MTHRLHLYLFRINCVLCLMFLFLFSINAQDSLISSNSIIVVHDSTSLIDINSYLFVSEAKVSPQSVDDFENINDWKHFANFKNTENQSQIFVRFSIQNLDTSNSKKILYLHDLQEVTIYSNTRRSQSAGIVFPYEKRSLRKGLIIPLKGNSTQVELDLKPGMNIFYLDVKFLVRELFRPEIKLFSTEKWQKSILYYIGLFYF